MQTLIKKTDIKPFAPEQKPPGKAPAKVLIGVAFLSVLAFFAAVYLPDGKNDAEYLDELIERKEKGEILPSGEEKDFCILMASLRDSILLDCMPVLEGINWERPPKSPEALGPDWVEITSDKQDEDATTRKFQHLVYKKLIIYFDKGDPSDNGFAAQDHWHRQNPNATHKVKYARLDKHGKPVHRKSGSSHLIVRK